MVKIFLDTTTIHKNWQLKGEPFKALEQLIASGAASVYISQVSVRELVRQHTKETSTLRVRIARDWAELLKAMTIGDSNQMPALPMVMSESDVEAKFLAQAKDLGINITPLPKVSQSEMLERDLAMKKPFDEKGKGYRDTLIWFGILGELSDQVSAVHIVTGNTKDFGGKDGELEAELVAELKAAAPNATIALHSILLDLIHALGEPQTQATKISLAEPSADQEMKEPVGSKLLDEIKTGKYSLFKLDSVISEGLEGFEMYELSGSVIANGVELEEPIHAMSLEFEGDSEATGVYEMTGGLYACIGNALGNATIEGYMDKMDAFLASESGYLYVTDPQWNEHMSEVEMSDVSVKFDFQFEFDPTSGEVVRFRVTEITLQ